MHRRTAPKNNQAKLLKRATQAASNAIVGISGTARRPGAPLDGSPFPADETTIIGLDGEEVYTALTDLDYTNDSHALTQ
jgi:hypothetical protein